MNKQQPVYEIQIQNDDGEWERCSGLLADRAYAEWIAFEIHHHRGETWRVVEVDLRQEAA